MLPGAKSTFLGRASWGDQDHAAPQLISEAGKACHSIFALVWSPKQQSPGGPNVMRDCLFAFGHAMHSGLMNTD